MQDGFGISPEGEDQFDAVVGCLSMINVAAGRWPGDAPSAREVRTLEGWILGQAA
jgi:hypothetical protein